MISKACLSITDVDQIIAAARVAAHTAGVGVTICVVDEAGNLLRLDRLDGAPLVSLRVAEGKARTAAEMRMSTAMIEHIAADMPSVIAIANIHPFRGGLPLFSEGHCVGAIGVSGALPDQDVQIAECGANVITAES